MTTSIETDLKEILISLRKDVSDIKNELSGINTRLTALELGQARIEGKLEGMQLFLQKVPDLAEKVGELKNWKQIGLIIATAMISSILSSIIGGVIGYLIRGSKIIL
jgi:hypothetical protein